MLWDEVKKHVYEINNGIVQGEFHIGLAPLIDYVFFYWMVENLQENESEDKQSIYKYVKCHFKKTDISESVIDSFYEKTLYQFNTLSLMNKLKHINRHEQEKLDRLYKVEQGFNPNSVNPKRYQGIDLYTYQLNEFEILKRIKEGEFDCKNASRTYKRLVSDKGYMHLITFRDYRDFVEILETDIESQSDLSNVAFYKLEKTLNMELLKSSAKALKLCREDSEFNETQTIKDLLLVFQLPFIDARQDYTTIYPELTSEEKSRWRLEIESLMNFISHCLMSLRRERQTLTSYETQEDWIKLQTIYPPSSYKNDYKQRKDFQSKDFQAILKVLDELNTKAFQAIKNNIENQQ